MQSASPRSVYQHCIISIMAATSRCRLGRRAPNPSITARIRANIVLWRACVLTLWDIARWAAPDTPCGPSAGVSLYFYTYSIARIPLQ
jgi:hypothetical protein